MVVKILIKHKINEVLYFGVKKVVFEQLKLCNLERIAFHRNWRLSYREHPLKITPWSVNPFRFCKSFEVYNTKKILPTDSKLLLSSIFSIFESQIKLCSNGYERNNFLCIIFIFTNLHNKHVFVKHCCGNKVKLWQKICKSNILTLPQPQGHGMSVKC